LFTDILAFLQRSTSFVSKHKTLRFSSPIFFKLFVGKNETNVNNERSKKCLGFRSYHNIGEEKKTDKTDFVIKRRGKERQVTYSKALICSKMTFIKKKLD